VTRHHGRTSVAPIDAATILDAAYSRASALTGPSRAALRAGTKPKTMPIVEAGTPA
jgi:hypothetical protein